jgi:nuclear receptor subfamily 1 group D member 3
MNLMTGLPQVVTCVFCELEKVLCSNSKKDKENFTKCASFFSFLQACPLNPAPELQSEQEFSQRFAHVIRGVIDFAGMIPGFQMLTQDDKFTLLKAGLFDALFVRLICMFDSSINSIICLNGQVMRRDSIQNGANARFLVDSTFNFAERMNSMQLTDAEIGLFCAIVLITPDRPGLRNVELIERMYSKLKACLQSVITSNRPDKPEFMQELLKTLPDLRTLSTLHTEKLVVFRTEHKELLRQQMWTAEEEAASKSPGSSSWGCDGSSSVEDIAKSPMGSVSSTESGDTFCSSDYTSAMTAAAPLLAATLSGGCPMMHRGSGSGSSAEDDIVGAAHLAQNGLTITPVVRAVPITAHHIRYRKLDSPTDSGIESGNEKHEHHKVPSSGSSSCSSPRSSLEDQTEDKRHIVEDMPVLKRVLQAPPLYDTNSLMDEAYKPHKKFRAMRHRESETDEPQSSTHQSPMHQPQQHQSQLHMHLTRPQSHSSSASHHHQQQQHQQQHQHQQQQHQQTSSSLLSSTHSVLAKSLMAEPRMTPEQMKRSDIIQNYIMRESQQQAAAHLLQHGTSGSSLFKSAIMSSPHHSSSAASSPSISMSSNQQGLLVCTSASASPQPQQGSCPYSNGRWHGNTSVITTTSRQQTPSPPNSTNTDHQRYFQSPHSTSTSPPGASSPPSAAPSPSPRLLELQVDCIATGTSVAAVAATGLGADHQPLNLSKKSPSPPPRNVVGKVLLEA